MLIAVTRDVSQSIVDCELTFLQREPIDVERARLQHRQYEEALRHLELAVLSLPGRMDLPDSVFVEDTALVLDECAVLTRPGAESRRPEIDLMAEVLAPYRKVLRIDAPARVDGGDILCLGKKVFIGLSARSERNAVQQMQERVGSYGYEVHSVPVTGCLHLKSAVTQVTEDTLLINPSWVDKSAFKGWDFIEIDPSEPYAANAVLVKGHIIYANSHPKTQQRLVGAGIRMILVDADELAKAEGAVTCCSLIFNV